jgi:hypothetical protein
MCSRAPKINLVLLFYLFPVSILLVLRRIFGPERDQVIGWLVSLYFNDALSVTRLFSVDDKVSE